MNYSTTNQTSVSSYNEYMTSVLTTVNANSAQHLSGNKTYLDSLNVLKDKASMYVNSVNTANRSLNVEKKIMTENKSKLLNEYQGDATKFSQYLKFRLPDITSHENYITKLTTFFDNFQTTKTSIGSQTITTIDNTAVKNFKKHVEATYTNLNIMLDVIYNFHRACKPYIKKYGICSAFYDNYLTAINTNFIQAVNIIQQYNIIRVDHTSDVASNTSERIYDHELFLTNIGEQISFLVDQSRLNNLSTIKDMSSMHEQQITKILSDYINGLKSKRSALTNKTINILDEILSDNCDFALTASYSKFNDYTLNINIECAIERNDVHNLECKNFLYILFNNLKNVRDDIKIIKSKPFDGDLTQSLTIAFSDIYQRRLKHIIKITNSSQNIYVRLPYLINYCELISLCNEISKKNKNSFGDILYEIFSDLSKINVSSSEGEQIESDAVYDKLLASIISNYILNFNMIAFHKKSNTILRPEEMNAIKLSTILYNIATDNVYVNDVDICSMTKKPTDISKGSGKTKLSMIICYASLIVAIVFNIVMFIFKEKIKAKFDDPTKTKIINNIFYWINLGCIIAAGLSSFLRITDVYSTSLFTRLGVIVTVNVVTMIFCSFSLYFIDPNTFWNTTAKTGETKNTENTNANTNTNQQSSN